MLFVINLPQGINAAQLEALKEAVAPEVAAARAAYRYPVVVIVGDFNHRDFGPVLGEVEDLVVVETVPTRGNNAIEKIYSNIPDKIMERLMLPPLQANNGTVSDPLCVYVAAMLGDSRKFKWTVKMRRTRNQKREEAFADEVRSWDWS